MRMEDRFDAMVNDMVSSGFSINDDILPHDDVAALALVARKHHERGTLIKAGTGKDRFEEDSIRGDSIAWLDRDASEQAVIDCLIQFEGLRQAFNRQLFMNLHDVESHFAIYPPGARYQKHVDQFATGDQRRQVSLVVYLNDDWVATDGGALRLYLDDSEGTEVDISPIGGRMVLFESSRFWHEVLPSSRERVSIAGWFRTRS